MFLIFLSEPIRSLSTFEEIQFVYYQLNSNAGLARSTNIGSFPIEIKYLETVLKDHISEKRNVNLTINEFVGLIQSAIVNDPRSLAYGLRGSYTEATKEEPSDVRKDVKIENVFAEIIGKEGGTFKYPAIEAYLETRGGKVFKNEQLVSEHAKKDILRIHIYDKQSSPYESYLQLYRTQSGLQEIIDSKKLSEKSSYNISLANIRSLCSSVGIQFKQNDETSKIDIVTQDISQLKDFLAKAIPYVTYGSSASSIISANLQTQQNQQLSTVQMLRSAGEQNNVEPNGSATGGIPLRIIPCQLDMETFGCALYNINQQFFVDFNTGTSADNIYLLTHLVHTIKPGRFTSNIKMTPLDAYGVLESIVSKIKQIVGYLEEDTKKTQ